MRIKDLTNNSQLDEGFLKDLHQRAIQQIIDWALPPQKREEIEKEISIMTQDELQKIKNSVENSNRNPADFSFEVLFRYELAVERLKNTETISESKKKTLKDKDPTVRNSKTHSVIDGLNRARGAIDSGEKFIYAKEIDRGKLKPLNPQEIKRLDQIASKAKKKGDYYTGSTFGNGKDFYSVEAAAELALNAKPIKLSLNPGSFVYDQVTSWWQGDKQRARKAIESSGPNAKKHPILIAKN